MLLDTAEHAMSRSYSARSTPHTPKDCDAEFLIDFDGLDCYLPFGHDGLHATKGIDGWVSWQKGRNDG